MTVKKIVKFSISAVLLLSLQVNLCFAIEQIPNVDFATSGTTENIENKQEINDEQSESVESTTTETIPESGEKDETDAELNAEAVEVKVNNEGFELVEAYSFNKPDGVDVEKIEYNKYNIGYFYVVAVNNAVNIRKEPTVESAVVKQLGLYGKLNTFEKVKGQYIQKTNSDEWYRVYWYDKDTIQTGYVYSKIVRFRTFRMDIAKAKIDELQSYLTEHDNMARISNYKNYSGTAPAYNGQSFDAFGISRDQAAPMYTEAKTTSEMRYLPDGMIVDVVGAENGLYKVHVFDHDAYGYVPKKYLSFQNQVKNLNQVIFVDIKNQNISSYELADGIWVLKSLAYATTGMEAEFKEPTAPGTYAAIQKKDKFLYLDDVTKELDGYAPFAIRFNGGAYLHGFPVNYKWDTVQELVQEAQYDEKGQLVQEAVYEEKRVGSPIDPGLIEYSYTLGTIPLSHKCVRNPTSHAEFLYNWIVLNESMIIVAD